MAGSAASLLRPIFSPPVLPDDVPNLYEDEDEDDMGDSNIHRISTDILLYGVSAHLKRYFPDCQMFGNLNLYYKDGPPHPRTGALPYVSPDGMVVKPSTELVGDIPSYTIGKDGPAPILTGEVLSRRSAQQRDLREKLVVYAFLKVPEYVLIDVTGKFLKARLLLKRLQKNGDWKDEHDSAAGVASQLGFRLVLDPEDGQLRVIDAKTGHRYLRPAEAEDSVRAAEEKARALEAELARLKKQKPKRKK